MKAEIVRTLKVSWNTVGEELRQWLVEGFEAAGKAVKAVREAEAGADENTHEGRTRQRLHHRPLDTEEGGGGDQTGVWCRTQCHSCLEGAAGLGRRIHLPQLVAKERNVVFANEWLKRE